MNRRNILVYISGKFSDPKPQEVQINIRKAAQAAASVWNLGFTAICPHLNAPQMEHGCNCRYEEYMEGDLAILGRCDVVLMLPGWKESPGANVEMSEAIRLKKRVCSSVHDLLALYPLSFGHRLPQVL